MQRIPNSIPKVYMKHAIENIIFGFFMAKRQDTTLSKKKIAIDFQNTFGYDEDELPFETIIMVFRRMNHLNIEAKKTKDLFELPPN